MARRFAQLRREESNAERAQVARERWDQEQAKAKELKRATGTLMPLQALLIQQCYLEMFSRASGTSQEAAVGCGEAMLDVDQSSAAGDNPTQSD